MYTILLAAFIGISLCAGLGSTGSSSWGWAVFWGMLAFVATFAGLGLYFQSRIKVIGMTLQEVMKSGQAKIQAMVNGWQMRPPGSVKQAQDSIQREQAKSADAALAVAAKLDRYNRWVPMMERQSAAIRLQLYWAKRDFRQVDALLPKALMLDPMIVCMKIARMYVKGEKEGMEKLFTRTTARLRYGQGALLYALYSWILVKQGEIDAAHKILVHACEKMENATLKANRDNLANNRIAHFSNAGFGDEWYALLLEEPKVRMQRQQPRFGRPF
ncbi:MAG: hypothetical protein J5985_03150 [Kiritimatiellae bacterium]|nr:hypothetical protein [Kiritimatiellia bacterium]